jgi:hypothetical protein
MTGSRSRIGFFAAAILFAPMALIAEDPTPPATIASVELKDGRVLHNVKVMSDEGANIVVHADEGLLKIAKSNLPAALADAFAAKPAPPPTGGPPEFVMQRFDPNQPPEAPPPAPGAKPKANPGAKPPPSPSPMASAVYKGCTIISFQIKSFQNVRGCAEIVIRNDTDQTVQIRPGEITCITADGARHLARNIITDSFPPAVKRREFVPARGELDDIFAFANEPLAISSVQWSR